MTDYVELHALRLIALERSPALHTVVWSYDLFLYSTPFLVCSMIFSLLYVHLYRAKSQITVEGYEDGCPLSPAAASRCGWTPPQSPAASSKLSRRHASSRVFAPKELS